MIVTTYYNCPRCDSENSTQFDVGEHFTDEIDYCASCGEKYTDLEREKIFLELEEQAAGSEIDMAEMYREDR